MSITPYLVVRGAARAIEFYIAAFEAVEAFRMTDPSDGRIGHAELTIGGGVVMLADEYPDFGAVSPDCPSSDDLRLFSFLRNGGSGSAGFEVMRPAGDAASVCVGWCSA